MTIEIRRIRPRELHAFVEARFQAFLDPPPSPAATEEVRPFWDLERVWAAFEGDLLVGTFRSIATELTVPGGAQVPAAAVTNVTVRPTHRRQGILRQLVAAEHGAMRERGDAIGILYSAEYPLYGRFGYGSGTRLTTWTIDRLGAAGLHGEPTGGMEIVRPTPAIRDAVHAAFDAARRLQPGEIRRPEEFWDRDLGLRDTAWGPRWNGYLAVHRDALATVDGYVRYRTDAHWSGGEARGTITLDDLHAATDRAYVALWRFLVGIDLVATIRATFRSPAEPLPWLLVNARAAAPSVGVDGLWLRLMDIPRALQVRTYEREASLVLEVVDEELPDGRTRIHLDAGPDGATAATTTRTPDVTLAVGALSAAYLGGTALRDAARATGLDEHRPGAAAAAEALFRTALEPWCSTNF